MSSPIYIYLAVEDDLSEAILRKILLQSQRNYQVIQCLKKGGSGELKKRVREFNKAQGTPFLLLTDLDATECAPVLIRNWLPIPQHPNLIFRVAVKEVESWILAHRHAFAQFLGILPERIPLVTDTIENPKQFLIKLSRKCRRRELKEGIVPKPNSTAKQGPDYNAILGRFIQSNWDVHIAQKHSPSLCRAFQALNQFEPQ